MGKRLHNINSMAKKRVLKFLQLNKSKTLKQNKKADKNLG